MIPQSSIQRPPKSLSSNFMPTNTQRNERFKNRSQEQQGTRMNQNNMNKDEREYKNDTDSTDNRSRNNGFVNGFDVPIESKEHKEQNLNLSNNSSDSRNSYKKSSIPRQMANNNGRQRHFREEIGNLNLEIGKIHHSALTLQVTPTIVGKCTTTKEKVSELLNMQQKLFKVHSTKNRARVINVNPLTVHFIDFGNKSQVQAVKPLPDEFRKIPALAARITPNQLPDVQDMTDVHIKVKKQDQNMDFVNTARQINFNETKAVKPTELKEADISKEQFYFEVPKPIATLQNGDKVMVIDTDTNKFLVRTRECAVKSRELTEYIKNLDKSALTLTNVKVGQLVLCSKDGLVGLYRAVVTKKESGSVVSVKYIDFPGEDDLSVKSLRNIDEYLANEPTSIILSPEYKVLNNMEEKVLSGEDFDLQFDDGTLLSKKIQDIKCPTPKQTTVKPVEVKPSTTKESVQSEKKPEPQPCSATNTKVLYEDMDWVNIEPGTYTFMCYSFQDLNDITMISTTEDVITYLEEITDLEITDNAPYKPEEFEMCLVSFKGPEEENASWYRAAVLEIEDDSYFVTFVDFGNKEVVKCEDIRKFPPNLKKVPILGVNCKCVGIPDTPEVVKQLKELIREGDQVEVIVKGLSDLTYEIEIPDLYQKLKSD
ncbi:hypothetical protein NQ314_010087 [Rhamnusium bicolor]|uniref:Tudor domain-containing protein n=1 Tax=Rhamnusium bicolor TaxID=1586634 RepID=A0AAV8XVR5_9CUCU|nr:hypothetical protein NQ314_010087 [Rhamnusium bicolor]